MNPKNAIPIFIIAFITGYVTCLYINPPILTKDNIGNIKNGLEFIATISMAIAALMALYIWRSQIKYGNIYSIATELEFALTRFLILSSNNKNLHGKSEFREIGNIVITKRLQLLQREFHPEIMELIETSFRKSISEAEKNGSISQESNGDLHSALRMLSGAINKEFKMIWHNK
jgi:hypothetical protein